MARDLDHMPVGDAEKLLSWAEVVLVWDPTAIRGTGYRGPVVVVHRVEVAPLCEEMSAALSGALRRL